MKHLNVILTALACGALGATVASMVGAVWDWVRRPKKTKVQP